MQELFDAIKAGDLSKVTALLDQDPSLANAYSNGVSVILTAKFLRRDDMVKLLETRGAVLDVFASAALGRTARIEELVSGNRSLATALSTDGWTPLHLAAFFGQLDTAKALLNRGAQVNARSTNAMQNLPVHAAAAGGRVAMVKLLVDFGASVNARQNGGWAPIHAAAQNGNVEMAEVLASGGADLSLRADNQQRAIDLALTRGCQAMVTFLESKGASL